MIYRDFRALLQEININAHGTKEILYSRLLTLLLVTNTTFGYSDYMTNYEVQLASHQPLNCSAYAT